MPKILGTGEQSERLRRLLDLRGRIDTSIDETVVPTILVGDATGPGYRRSGRKWRVALSMAVSGTLNSWLLCNSGARLIVIDEIYLEDQTLPEYDPVSGAPTIFAHNWELGPYSSTDNIAEWAVAAIPQTSELLKSEANVVVPVPLELRTSLTNHASGQIDYRVQLWPQRQYRLTGLDFILPPQFQANVGLNPTGYVVTSPAGRAGNVSFFGRIFDDVPQTFFP